MTRATIAGGAFGIALVLLAIGFVVRYSAVEGDGEPARESQPVIAIEIDPGFIYGRITDADGITYEGRLRWGGDQEAFWGDYFDGLKPENPWTVHMPQERPTEDRRSIEIFGIKIGDEERRVIRPFMARFGDVAHVEAHFGEVNVTLKSGTMFKLDRFSAGDIDDGVRVWDRRRGVVDLDAREIRTIEFRSTASPGAASDRLHGTVRTRQGDFTGFIQWDRQDVAGADELEGRTGDGEVSLRYDTIRSIARYSRDSAQLTLLDGREMVLSGTREAGRGHRGITVDDDRYGRVQISWNAFERVEFSRGGSSPAYGDFPPGRPLAGTVTTRDGRSIAGRLVYDFDESETTETFDVSYQGVDYNIPFGLITSIVPPGRDDRGAQHATVTLQSGEELPFERDGDLGDGNAGILIFVDGRGGPEYVRWVDVHQIDLHK